MEAEIEALLCNVDTLFLNQHEALEITGSRAETAVNALLERGVDTVILSRGEKGAMIGTKSDISTIPAIVCEVVDSTGAGDTLQGVALAAAALRRRKVDIRAVEIAARAAALTVARYGTRSAFPTEAELHRLLRL